jgi:hypothetical protein
MLWIICWPRLQGQIDKQPARSPWEALSFEIYLLLKPILGAKASLSSKSPSKSTPEN